jgi:hypothetical protein
MVPFHILAEHDEINHPAFKRISEKYKAERG